MKEFLNYIKDKEGPLSVVELKKVFTKNKLSAWGLKIEGDFIVFRHGLYKSMISSNLILCLFVENTYKGKDAEILSLALTSCREELKVMDEAFKKSNLTASGIYGVDDTEQRGHELLSYRVALNNRVIYYRTQLLKSSNKKLKIKAIFS